MNQKDQAINGMALLFDLQEDVEKSWGRLPDPNDPEHVSTYVREVILCATDELHEVLAEVHWKPWKQQRGIKNRDNYREELADVLHFVIDLYLAAGLTSKEMVEDYMSKHDTNMVRSQSEEYKAS